MSEKPSKLELTIAANILMIGANSMPPSSILTSIEGVRKWLAEAEAKGKVARWLQAQAEQLS